MLTPADAFRFRMATHRNPMEIAVLLQLDGRMQPEELERFATERLLCHARFRYTVAASAFTPRLPRWRLEPDFSLPAHVHAGMQELSPGALRQDISQRISQPLPFARSPWSLDLWPTEGDTSAMLFRVHHCIADGVALVALLGELADLPHPPRRDPHPHSDGRVPRKGRKPRWRQAWRLVESVPQLLTTRADQAPHLHELSGRKRVSWSDAIALDQVMRAAGEGGQHVTDLLLCAAASAVAAGLQAADEPVPDLLHALVPFGGGLGADELSNHYASQFVALPMQETDDRQRALRIAAETHALRDPLLTRVALALVVSAGLLAPPIIRFGVDQISRRASLVLSNVAGPAQRVRLMGHEVRSIIAFAPPSGRIGLSFTLLGYAGELRLGVQADTALPLRPEQLAADFERALRALMA